jgi:hypothetical protein
VKANSPRRPGPAETPGQDVTSAVIRSLAVGDVIMQTWCTFKCT